VDKTQGEKKDMEAVSLCGKPGGKCCPVLSKKAKKYSVSDKGQVVSFTKGQLKVLCKELCKICGCD